MYTFGIVGIGILHFNINVFKIENAILSNLYYPSNNMVKSLDYLNITLEKILLSEFFFFPLR